MPINRAQTTRTVRLLAAVAALVVAAATAAPAHASDARKKKHHKKPYSVSEAVSRSSVLPGATVVVSGKVTPKAKGRTVTVQRRVGSGGWVSVAHRTLPRSSRYSASLKLSAAGSYGFRVYVPGSRKRRAGLSAVHTVKVAPPAWRAVASGGSHACGVKKDGSLWCWGYNQYGQLGSTTHVGTATPTPEPQRVGTGRSWVAVTSGGNFSCAVRSDHTAWCWGFNAQGQLGNASNAGTSNINASPLPVGGGAVWASVSAGSDGNHACGTRLNHTVWCWGSDFFGQLGDGTSGSSSEHHTPVQAGTGTTYTNVSGGGNHTCARRSNGTLWCWGYDDYGQVGNGSTSTAVATPTQVGAATSWTTPGLGEFQSCATRSDRSLWCWGLNTYGEVGSSTDVGTSTGLSSPVQVGSATTWSGPTGGGFFTCAHQVNGSAWCWGNNQYGQLGNATGSGTNTANPAPLQVSGGGRYTQLSAGDSSTCGVRTDGTAWCWGSNTSGQLGNATNSGTMTPTPTPLKVG